MRQTPEQHMAILEGTAADPCDWRQKDFVSGVFGLFIVFCWFSVRVVWLDCGNLNRPIETDLFVSR